MSAIIVINSVCWVRKFLHFPIRIQYRNEIVCARFRCLPCAGEPINKFWIYFDILSIFAFAWIGLLWFSRAAAQIDSMMTKDQHVHVAYRKIEFEKMFLVPAINWLTILLLCLRHFQTMQRLVALSKDSWVKFLQHGIVCDGRKSNEFHTNMQKL